MKREYWIKVFCEAGLFGLAVILMPIFIGYFFRRMFEPEMPDIPEKLADEIFADSASEAGA